MQNPSTVLTIGHSTRPIEEFIAMLKAHGVESLVDVRTVPRSRHNPQFEQQALARSMESAGIEYRHVKALGGLRKPRPDSINAGWRNESFRGYADYMQSDDFQQAIDDLLKLAEQKRVAVMCAEAVPWRCHRSLIADAVLVRGHPVAHIMSASRADPHRLTSFAKRTGLTLTYPPEEDEQGQLL